MWMAGIAFEELRQLCAPGSFFDLLWGTWNTLKCLAGRNENRDF